MLGSVPPAASSPAPAHLPAPAIPVPPLIPLRFPSITATPSMARPSRRARATSTTSTGGGSARSAWLGLGLTEHAAALRAKWRAGGEAAAPQPAPFTPPDPHATPHPTPHPTPHLIPPPRPQRPAAAVCALHPGLAGRGAVGPARPQHAQRRRHRGAARRVVQRGRPPARIPGARERSARDL